MSTSDFLKKRGNCDKCDACHDKRTEKRDCTREKSFELIIPSLSRSPSPWGRNVQKRSSARVENKANTVCAVVRRLVRNSTWIQCMTMMMCGVWIRQYSDVLIGKHPLPFWLQNNQSSCRNGSTSERDICVCLCAYAFSEALYGMNWFSFLLLLAICFPWGAWKNNMCVCVSIEARFLMMMMLCCGVFRGMQFP
jgi:hypothetical protein